MQGFYLLVSWKGFSPLNLVTQWRLFKNNADLTFTWLVSIQNWFLPQWCAFKTNNTVCTKLLKMWNLGEQLASYSVACDVRAQLLSFFITHIQSHARTFSARNVCGELKTPAQTAPLTLECSPPPYSVACFETGVVSHSSLGWETQIRHGRGPGGGMGGPRW